MEHMLVVSSVLGWIVLLFNMMLTLALVRAVSRSTNSDQLKPLRKGQVAPDFSATTLQGEPVTLASYRERAVGFVFIGPHCGPCREAIPRYEALGPQARRAGVELVLVSTASAAETQPFVEELNISLPVLIAPFESNTFMRSYGLDSTPSYCLINARGRVQSIGSTNAVGSDWHNLEQQWEATSYQRPGLAHA